VPGRFPLFTDNHVRQPLIDALVRCGWDVVRAIDVFPERTLDEVLFEYAAREGRAFVTNDARIHAIATEWMAQGHAFRMVFWTQLHHQRMSPGGFVEAFEDLARKPLAFAYAIEYIKPR
jgi:hypothetical protein